MSEKGPDDTGPGNEAVRHHLVTLRVENKAGVLVRVAGLFARRGFNIFSLAVAPTDDERFSRISVVVDLESAPLSQIREQLNKLVNVVEIKELDPADALEAELMLATVAVPGDDESLGRLVQAAGATVLQSNDEAATLMVSGPPKLLDTVTTALSRVGIVELQRTGRIGLPKLSASG